MYLYKPTVSLPVIPVAKNVGGGNIMFWGCFSAKTGRLPLIHGPMNRAVYCENLFEILFSSAGTLKMGHGWVFYRHNDLNTARATKEWLKKKHIKVAAWPGQSVDLHPLETLWKELKLPVSK